MRSGTFFRRERDGSVTSGIGGVYGVWGLGVDEVYMEVHSGNETPTRLVCERSRVERPTRRVDVRRGLSFRRDARGCRLRDLRGDDVRSVVGLGFWATERRL